MSAIESSAPNAYAIVDELAQVRDTLKQLQEREAFLRNEILRTGRSVLYGEGSVAVVQRSQRSSISSAKAKAQLDAETLASISQTSDVTTVKVTPLRDAFEGGDDIS